MFDCTLFFCYHFNDMKKLVVLSGVPGSGKSYFSELIKKSTTGHVYIISSDNLRKLIAGHQQNLDFDPLMWKIFYQLPRAFSLDEDAIVILDSTNTLSKYRVDATEELKQYFDEVDLVVFKIERDVLEKQNLEREFPIPIEALTYYYDNFEMPNEKDESFFDNIYIIESRDFHKTVYKIISNNEK